MMPRMDGFEMVRRIRQTDKQTPVLFLTARSAINDVVEGFELGANDYLKAFRNAGTHYPHKGPGRQSFFLYRGKAQRNPFLKSVTTVSIPSLNDLLFAGT